MAGTVDDTQHQDAPAAEAAASGAPPANGAAAAPPANGAAAPPQAPPDVVVPDDASRLCVNCAALLAEGQDWCLECGTAQPGRLGGRPGWRAALTVVAITALLAAGAIAAAYAALSSDAERRASAPAPPQAQPIVPPAPVQTTPAPAETTPEVAAPQDKGDDPTPKPSKDDEPDPVATPPSSGGSDTAPETDDGAPPQPGAGAPSDGGDTDSGDDPKPSKPKPATIALGPDAASTYDPFDRAGGLTGDPADAIDGRTATAWEAPVGQDGFVNIGLLVSLDRAQAFDKVRLRADTPGFTVELYGAKTGTPPEGDPAADGSGWKKLDDTRDFGTDEKFSVGEGKWRHVLLWFTEQPADTKVMIPEVELLR
ncbi:MAG TPA: hypothetical protein VHF89_14190 [Solirubrobacteraceae bacterium]|nr:hypothetical protein [Solirubrobacteraceae bacterium]